MSKPKKFVSGALAEHNLTTLKQMSRNNEKLFRELARTEFKLVNQQIRRTGSLKTPFTIRGKSNEQIIEMLKSSRDFANSKSYKKPTIKISKGKKKSKPRKNRTKTKRTPQAQPTNQQIIDFEELTASSLIVDDEPEYDFWNWQNNILDDILNNLKNEYPEFYDDLEKAREKYKEFDGEVEEMISSYINTADDMAPADIANSLRITLGARVGQILQKTNGEKTSYWNSFRS